MFVQDVLILYRSLNCKKEKYEVSPNEHYSII